MDLGSGFCGVKKTKGSSRFLQLLWKQRSSNLLKLVRRDAGSVDLDRTVPDTITKWAAGAFCVSSAGLGVAPSAALTAFQPFFVSLTLPYSVIRGEVFTLRASVFNYLAECIRVSARSSSAPFGRSGAIVSRLLSPPAGPGHAGEIGPVRLQGLRGLPVHRVCVQRGEPDLLLDRDSGCSGYQNLCFLLLLLPGAAATCITLTLTVIKRDFTSLERNTDDVCSVSR